MTKHLPPPTRYGPIGLQRAAAPPARTIAPPPTRYAPPAGAGASLQAKRAARSVRAPSAVRGMAVQRADTSKTFTATEVQGVSMEGQLLAGSLNCGRYCAIAAIASVCKIDKQTIKRLLPRPNQTLLGKTYGWSPGGAGQKFFEMLAKPDTPKAWAEYLAQYGPVIVSGPLALGFGHFVLIVGIKPAKDGDYTFVALDSFSLSKSGARKEWSFKAYQDKFDDEVYCVRKKAVTEAAASLT